jgi:hypothetical protein
MIVDSHAAVRFLETAFEPGDWIALLLKSYATGHVTQRVGPLSRFLRPSIHRWLRAMNARGYNVYVTVNALRAGARDRTKASVAAVRHVFLEADGNGDSVLAAIDAAEYLPPPSYVLTSSPDHVHIFWRVDDVEAGSVERLQKHLAQRFGTDAAATACSQTTRLPGYRNRKYEPPALVTIAYRDRCRRYGPDAFPAPPPPSAERATVVGVAATFAGDALERARRYLARVEPAVAGAHGDLHTFRVCCRIVRGFDLTDADALAALQDWNRRCEPPWTDGELLTKIAGARRYGREPIGALL